MASRALRGNGYVEKEKKDSIIEVAKRIGYIPNLTARSLRQYKSKTIGLMLMKGMSLLEYSIQEELQKHGYRLLIVYSNGDADRERECFLTMLSSRVDGILAFFSNYRNQDLVDICLKNEIPILQLFGQQYDGLKTVIADDEEITYDITHYLISCGHRNILFLERKLAEPDDMAHPVNGCFSGFCRAMSEVDITVDYNDFYCLPIEDGIDEAIRKSIAQRRPTAIIGANSEIASIALEYLHSEKIQVGKDVSFVSYDDNAWCSCMDITAYAHNHKAFGCCCARTIVSLIAGEKQPELQKVYTTLHERNSIAAI